MTNSVKNGALWRKLHLALVWSVVGCWSAGLVLLAVFPDFRTPPARGLALGAGALVPHFWLGRSLWHDPNRTGIGIPIALLIIRFTVSLILISIVLMQFPNEKRFIAYTVASLITVSTSIESFLFCKGVERL